MTGWPKDGKNMRLSTSTNIYLRRPDGRIATVEESMVRCARAGYRVMDLNFYDCTSFRSAFVTDDWRAWIEDIRMLADQLGLTFSQAHGSFYNFCEKNLPEREFWETSVLRSILCAEIMEIPWVVIHAGTAFDADDYRLVSLKRNLEYFKGLLDFAISHHVGIAIENLWDKAIRPQRRYTANAEELMELIDACSAFAGSWVGACWDFEHADIMGQSQREGLLRIGDRLRATHVSDQTGIDNDHILPFFGGIDWKEMVGILREIGYGGDFTYEIHRYTSKIPEKLVDAALEYSVKTGEYLLSM